MILISKRGLLPLPAYHEGLERKRHWYEEQFGTPVLSDGAFKGRKVAQGTFPLVISSRDKEDSGIDVPRIEKLARMYVLLVEESQGG